MNILRRVLRPTGISGLKAKIHRTLLQRGQGPDTIRIAKEKVLTHLLELHGRTVAYGPFSGMKLAEETWWGGFDVIPKILGVYEEHVVSALFELLDRVDGPFVDIGAADGFYACGVALSRPSVSVYAFEESKKGRKSLDANAKLNGCAELIDVQGAASLKCLKTLAKEHEQAVILMDIEGFEYDLLQEKGLSDLSNLHMIVELHPWKSNNGSKKQSLLLELASEFFDVEFIHRKSYNPNAFWELSNFSDDERLLSMSEGRPENMDWLVLSPKNQ